MISLYLGLPGCGKTTLMTKLAIEGLRKYDHVYCNVRLNIPMVKYIDNSMVGKYQLENGLVLIDEGEIFAEARDYKNFPKSMSDWFMLHRHYKCDVAIFAQRFKGVDVKIRNLSEKTWLVRRSVIPGVSTVTPIDYKLIIPEDGDRAGEIIEGYKLPSRLVRLFTTKRFIRRPYYKFFDSWSAPRLQELNMPRGCVPNLARLNRKIHNLEVFNMKKTYSYSLDDYAVMIECFRELQYGPASKFSLFVMSEYYRDWISYPRDMQVVACDLFGVSRREFVKVMNSYFSQN